MALHELLIVSVTPQNLERGTLWFREHFSSIKKSRATNPWWREHAFILEENAVLKPGALARKLVDFGYERGEISLGKGIFAIHGGVVEVWPINADEPYLLEFSGNTIIAIRPHERKEILSPKPKRYSLDALAPESYVVHVDHGIGIFKGTVNPSGNGANNFFAVAYAPARPGGTPDMLYVPTNQKNRLSPYIGFETPRIHRLGGTIWVATKRKAREDAEKFARTLLQLYAKRECITRPPHEGDTALEAQIIHAFPFAETEDQLRAEEDVYRDFSKSKPMDRILCGDVGFGKTEIALRAAVRVITSGKQVALLAPTTILAAQHERTFRERLADTPIRVAALSRLTPRAEEQKILAAIKNGSLDCLIGTHRLLSKDVQFKNLNLVIIDEEQRFGVRQKEHFKEFRAAIDALSLSATPIPRTISLSLAAIRDISLLSSPPPKRKAIITSVLPHSNTTISRALLFELRRGGQIYFLHNRIETLGAVKKKIEQMTEGMPFRHAYEKKTRIGVIHGRMKEKEIIRVMEQFYNRELDVLLATTIIENGLDISSANTLIVDDATRLGLAQAHQLRGRIGRGETQGFAYFLFKPQYLGIRAAERLAALKEYAALGAGYEIALRDLEIRGAGNVLGKEQSGTLCRVGLNLYCQMLAEAVEELKSSPIEAKPR